MTQPQYRGPTYIKPIDPIAIARVDVDAVPVDASGATVPVALVADEHNHGETAFGDARAATLHPIAGWSFAYGINGRHITATQAAGGVVSSSLGRASLTVTAAGDAAVIESRKALRYLPGLGALFRGTGVWAGAPWVDDNLTAIMGISDSTDGFFIGYVDGVFGFLRRNSGGVDVFTPRTSFNIDPDTATGTGPTGITFDPQFGHPFQIQYQWLGYGAITLYFEDPTTGHFEPVHRVMYAGTSALTSIRNPDLPCHAEVVAAVGYAGGAKTFYTPSAMAFSEGEQNAALTAQWCVGTAKAVTTVELPILSLLNGTTFATITNRIRGYLASIDICATINTGAPRSATFRLYRGTAAAIAAALTGEAFGAVSADSCMTWDSTASAVNPAGLIKLWEHRIAIPGDHLDAFPTYVPTLAPGEGWIMTAVVNTSTADCEAVLTWVEPL